jgi:hypothetical protein
VTRELIDALLLPQDAEFSTDFGHVNHGGSWAPGAVFELGAWWQAPPDARVEAVLRRACRDSNHATAQAARPALGEDQN